MTLTINGVDLEDPDGRWSGFTWSGNVLRGTVDPAYRWDFFTEISEGKRTLRSTRPTYTDENGDEQPVIDPLADRAHRLLHEVIEQ